MGRQFIVHGRRSYTAVRVWRKPVLATQSSDMLTNLVLFRRSNRVDAIFSAVHANTAAKSVGIRYSGSVHYMIGLSNCEIQRKHWRKSAASASVRGVCVCVYTRAYVRTHNTRMKITKIVAREWAILENYEISLLLRARFGHSVCERGARDSCCCYCWRCWCCSAILFHRLVQLSHWNQVAYTFLSSARFTCCVSLAVQWHCSLSSGSLNAQFSPVPFAVRRTHSNWFCFSGKTRCQKLAIGDPHTHATHWAHLYLQWKSAFWADRGILLPTAFGSA